MRIENGKLIYEVVTCWNCNGTKKEKKYTLCPLMHKAVVKYPKHVCPHCGSKNKYSHTSIGEPESITCHICNGQGTRQENEYDHVSQDKWNQWVTEGHFTFGIQRVNRDTPMVEQIFGNFESLFGCVDYGRTRDLSDEDVFARVPFESHPPQPIQWVKKDGTIPTKLVIRITRDGYGVYPIENLKD